MLELSLLGITYEHLKLTPELEKDTVYTSAATNFVWEGDFTDTLGKKATVDDEFIYQTEVFLKREKDVDDFDKIFYLLNQASSDDVQFKYQFNFRTVPFDVDETVTIRFCVIDSEQYYC